MKNLTIPVRFSAPRRALTAVFTGLTLCVLVPSLSAQADNGQNGGRRSRGGQDNGNGGERPYMMVKGYQQPKTADFIPGKTTSQ